MFILGAVFVPGLWWIVEYMFPFAIIWFLTVWFFALRIFWEYFTRIIVNGDFNFAANNNLGQMIAIFAFSMIWVWLAAPVAISHTKEVAAIAFFFSIFFITISIVLAFVKLTLWLKSIFRHGIAKEGAASLWIIIPILTLIWIAFVRQRHGLHSFDVHMSDFWLFLLTSVILSLQILFWFLGYKVMKVNWYFKEYVNGKEKSVWSYALVCPWVAFFVFGFFFVHLGLVKTEIIDKFWIIYFLLLLPIFYIKIKTILVMFKLNKKLI